MNERLHNPEDGLARLKLMYEALPKVPEDDPRVIAHQKHEKPFQVTQYGNNFYLLFWSLQEGQENTHPEYWEGYGGKLMREPAAATILEQPEVKAAIDFCGSEGWLNYRAYLRTFHDEQNKVLKSDITNKTDKLIEIAKICGGPLGMIRVEAAVWDSFNPLLEASAAKFLEAGIDPFEF